MHLYFITRGIQHEVDLWKISMQAQMFNWKRTNLATGLEENVLVQGALRPVQLWEYVFPEESLGEVLAMMDLNKKINGANISPAMKLQSATLRKVLGAKKISNIFSEVQKNRVMFGRVSIHPIGIREDDRRNMDEWKYEQEAL